MTRTTAAVVVLLMLLVSTTSLAVAGVPPAFLQVEQAWLSQHGVTVDSRLPRVNQVSKVDPTWGLAIVFTPGPPESAVTLLLRKTGDAWKVVKDEYGVLKKSSLGCGVPAAVRVDLGDLACNGATLPDKKLLKNPNPPAILLKLESAWLVRNGLPAIDTALTNNQVSHVDPTWGWGNVFTKPPQQIIDLQFHKVEGV